MITKKLNKYLLDPVKSAFVIRDLSYEQSSLDFLEKLSLFDLLYTTEILDEFVIDLFIEWELRKISLNFP
jgi:hypothetical protein